MIRFSFKTLLLMVLIVALLTGGIVMPETSRDRVLKRAQQFEGAKIELTESRFSEKDPRRWFFGNDAGRYIRKLSFPVRYQRKPDQKEFAGFDDRAGSLAVEKILCDWRGLTHLESLTLRSKFTTTEKTVQGLGELKALRFVWIEEVDIDDAAVRAMSQLENLEVLYLYNCRFSTDDFSVFDKLTHLAVVDISRDPDLSAQVSDNALKSLRAAASTAYVKITYARAFRTQKRKELFKQMKQEKQEKQAAAGESSR